MSVCCHLPSSHVKIKRKGQFSDTIDGEIQRQRLQNANMIFTMNNSEYKT